MPHTGDPYSDHDSDAAGTDPVRVAGLHRRADTHGGRPTRLYRGADYTLDADADATRVVWAYIDGHPDASTVGLTSTRAHGLTYTRADGLTFTRADGLTAGGADHHPDTGSVALVDRPHADTRAAGFAARDPVFRRLISFEFRGSSSSSCRGRQKAT